MQHGTCVGRIYEVESVACSSMSLLQCSEFNVNGRFYLLGCEPCRMHMEKAT